MGKKSQFWFLVRDSPEDIRRDGRLEVEVPDEAEDAQPDANGQTDEEPDEERDLADPPAVAGRHLELLG